MAFNGGGRGGGTGAGSKINASKNDNDSRKIFVGGLSWESSAEDLKAYFEKFGEVSDVTLKTDMATGRSRGFGFVLFADASTVDLVIASKNHVLHNKQIDPKRAVAGGVTGTEGVKKIFVGGLDPSLTEQDITEHFSQYGKVELVELPFDKTKSQRRAFGFITFESSDVVDKICENAKIPFGDKMLDVKKAAPKDQQEGGGRGGRGAGMMSRGRGRGTPGFGGYSAPGTGYDYNGTYQSGYTGYDYYGGQGAAPGGYGAAPGGYGAPAGAYGAPAPGYGAPAAGGYDSNYYSQQGWSGGYGAAAAPAGYGAPAAPAAGGYGGGYEYSGSWQGGSEASAYGKMKRGGAVAPASSAPYAGGATGYHPYNRW